LSFKSGQVTLPACAFGGEGDGMTRPETYFDDLRVGDTFTTRTYTVDKAAIIAFAREFDPQPFHLDVQAAKRSLFGGLVASGWHTAAITMRLLVTDGALIAGGTVGVGAELAWPTPTRPGDVLHAEVEVIELTPSRSRPDRGTAMLRITTLNQNGDVVQLLTARLLVPRRPPAAPSAD
jgi:acyl dehydratase